MKDDLICPRCHCEFEAKFWKSGECPVCLLEYWYEYGENDVGIYWEDFSTEINYVL